MRVRVKYLAFRLIFCILLLAITIFAWYPEYIFYFNTLPSDNFKTIYIVSKAAIGQYLWLHLFSADYQLINNGLCQYGNKTLKNINFIYLSGPGYIQNSIPVDIEYMILVLNGRTISKVAKAIEWLEYIPSMHSLKKVAIIMLGNERCDNHWILPYMKTNGGVINALFITYDTNIVNDIDIYQWPLGVATYRGFPSVLEINLREIKKKRTYLCNFIGSIYKNSSREILLKLLSNSPLKNLCYVLPRERWVPEESATSIQNYVDVLENSDFTLCPVGVNTECYRIYEALSLGSVPIVEDILTPGLCESPLRLLKKNNAPIIYVQSWNQLSDIILNDEQKNLSSIAEQRFKLVKWYNNFKESFSMNFISVLNKIFFPV